MAEVPRSSFIPKQTTTGISNRTKRKKRFNVMAFIGTVMLLGSLLIAGGTYLYKNYVEKELENQKTALVNERSKFNDSDFESIKELERLLNAAQYLLSIHVSPLKIFDTLERTTKESIQYTQFTFTHDPGAVATVEVIGATEEFKSVALQALQFGDDALFQDAAFSELADSSQASAEGDELTVDTSDPAPAVSFTVSGVISPNLIGYDGLSAPVEVDTFRNVSTSSDAGNGDGESASEDDQPGDPDDSTDNVNP